MRHIVASDDNILALDLAPPGEETRTMIRVVASSPEYHLCERAHVEVGQTRTDSRRTTWTGGSEASGTSCPEAA